MFVFRKIWRALLSCYLRFEVHPFALSPSAYGTEINKKFDAVQLICDLLNFQLVDIPNRCEIRKSHVDNFLRVIKNKASCLVSYVETKRLVVFK